MPLDYTLLQQAYEGAMSADEKPSAYVTSTRWLNRMGVMVQGPGPWLVTKDKITQIEIED